jgi:transposase, IS30 family
LINLDKKEKGQLAKSCNTFDCDIERENMKKYRQLTFSERIYIEVWHWERKSLSYMAERLGFNRSTISRELIRGATGELGMGYRADLAEKRCVIEGAKKGRKNKIVGTLEKLVLEKIVEKWSPAQISGRLKLEKKNGVSHETIYKYVQRDRKTGGNLYLSLRHGKRRRKKRFSIPRVRQDILNRINIKDRPEKINQRLRRGDWERDLVFGDSQSAAVLTIVDRKTLLTIIERVESKSPREISLKTFEALKEFKNINKSLTNDNGFEFRNHENESKNLGIPIYFTNPYSSWEKGTNENTNGLIRQYFPKKSSMKEFTNAKAKQVQQNLNTRPRKKLGFCTPVEAFYKKSQGSLLEPSIEGKSAVNS